MVFPLHSVTTGSRDRANVPLIIIIIIIIFVPVHTHIWIDCVMMIGLESPRIG